VNQIRTKLLCRSNIYPKNQIYNNNNNNNKALEVLFKSTDGKIKCSQVTPSVTQYPTSYVQATLIPSGKEIHLQVFFSDIVIQKSLTKATAAMSADITDVITPKMFLIFTPNALVYSQTLQHHKLSQTQLTSEAINNLS
jgi:hypothetical protein